jgi:fibronectin type 3 domain-containing protein
MKKYPVKYPVSWAVPKALLVLGTALALFAALLPACQNPDGGDDGQNETSPDGKTRICFVNTNDFSVSLYSDSTRLNKIAEVGAAAESAQVETEPNPGAVFYVRYHILIDDVALVYDGPGLAVRIDAEKITRVPVPLLSELEADELAKPVTADVHIKMQNTGNTALALRRGGYEEIPRGASSPIINSGETARYLVDGGPVSNYSFMKNTVTPLPFPAGLTALVPGHFYSFRFDGTVLTLLADKPLTVAQALKLQAPENISATSLANGHISLTWDRVGTETGYVIYRSESQTGTYTSAGTVQVTSYTDTAVAVGNTYYYRISAVKNNMESDKSVTVVSILAEINSLASPQGLSVTGRTENSVSLSWQTVSGAGSYKVYRGSASDTVNEYVMGVASLTCTVAGLTANTGYYFTVSAVHESGESLPSAAILGKTSLSAPQGLSVTGQTGNSVSLSWQTVSGATGYKVYRGSVSGAVNESVAETASASCTVTGLTANTSYYFTVRAVNESGESSPSATVTGKTSEMTAPVPVLSAGDLSISVSWAPVPSAASYSVYCNTAPVLPGTPYQTGITGTSVTITGLINERTYYVWVEAVNSGGKETSEAVSGAPQLPTVKEYMVYSNTGFTQAVTEINASPTRGFYRVTLFGDITANNASFSVTNAEKTIVIKGDTSLRTIFNTADANLFSVWGGNTLVLENNVKLNGNARTGNVVHIYNEGILIMKAGSRIENARVSAVYVNNGMFTMSGGEISGNTATAYGGGVYVSGGVFTMSDGEINRNTASSSYGGGVYVSGGTFTMSGGEISGNTASYSSSSYSYSSYGGGVYVSSGTFTMSGGEISGNTTSASSRSYGGGVYVSGGTFAMSGGEISGNTASASLSSYGGGVGISNGTFTKSGGGTISDTNTALNGKVAYVDSSPSKQRNTTAGPDVDMDSNKIGGAGGWD